MIIKYGVAVISIFIFILFSIHRAEGQNESGELKCVFLDAGHGGKDPGAVGAKTYEKHIVLPIVLKLGKMIKENYPDVKVVYSRQKDVPVDLRVRTRMANDCKADLFISVHANAVDNKSVSGLETYILGTNDSEHNLKVAMKENSVIRYEDNYDKEYAGFDPSRAESYIMFNFLRNMHLDQSLDIAAMIQKNLVKFTQRKDREVRQGPLWVLKDVAMPSTLVEVGYISNPAEEIFMMSAAGQDKIVKAIFKGFQEYKTKVDRIAKEKQMAIAKKEGGTGKEKAVPATQPAKKPEQANAKKPESQQAKPVRLDKPQQAEIGNNTAGIRPFYAIQVASASAKIQNMSRLCTGEKVYELYSGGRYRYYVVRSENYEAVKKNLQKIKNKVRDCFIIAVHKGKVIPVAEARKLK
ncbi:MAG: N-acetylmuramoyl-L-alanine amidase [Odoribacter splanchnicus]|nr:N-acetylmuramoyl-L-alanine amidase [Odoribacter splanchnicus]